MGWADENEVRVTCQQCEEVGTLCCGRLDDGRPSGLCVDCCCEHEPNLRRTLPQPASQGWDGKTRVVRDESAGELG